MLAKLRPGFIIEAGRSTAQRAGADREMKLVAFIALRQLWARNLLNGIAVVGVTLGVLTLILMNSIMQGFQMKFQGELLKVSPHVTVFDRQLGATGTLLDEPGPVLASVAHQQPSDRTTRVKRPRRVTRAIAKPCLELSDGKRL